jgi:hypothetical protein
LAKSRLVGRAGSIRIRFGRELKAGDAMVVRHIVEGRVAMSHAALWREQIEPLDDLVLEAPLDNVAAAVASGG